MVELIAFVVVLGMVLGIVALVGHGLWVMLAWTFGKRTPRPPHSHATVPACPRCHAPVDPVTLDCRVCCWPLSLPNEREEISLVAIRHQLERLRRLEWISPAVYERLVATLREARSDAVDVADSQSVADAQAPVEQPAAPAASDSHQEVVTTDVEVVDEYELEPLEEDTAARERSLEERARQYSERRQHAAAESIVATPILPPRPASQPLARILSSFMEEKNIRWGELVGGLLIVCCSIALVVSFWARIAERPFLKFFLFNGITAGLFGIGFYIHRRWRLPTTSHGLLIIATLLVPLNFLAIAAFTADSAPANAITIGGELVSIGLFVSLVYLAGRILVPVAPLWLVIGVLGPAISQLLMRRWIEPESGQLLLYALGSLPLGCYLATTAATLWQVRRVEEPGEDEANLLFKLLGMVTFAALLACGLLLVKTEHVAHSLRQLAPLVSITGVPALATGLFLWRRLAASSLVGLRTAGTSIAVAGAVTLLLGMVESWPTPAIMLPAGAVNVVAFTIVAIVFEIPAAHLLAAISLSAMYLVAFHVLSGTIPWRGAHAAEVIAAVLSARSGTALVAAVIALGAGAVVWLWRQRRAEAFFYGAAALAAAAASLALLAWFGFGRVGDPAGMTWVCALYAAGLLIGAKATGRAALGWGGSALLLLGLVQGIVFKLAPAVQLEHPWLAALLAHATISLAMGSAAARGTARIKAGLARPLWQAAMATCVATAPLLVWLAWQRAYAPLAGYLGWLAVLLLAIAWLRVWPVMFAAFQAALALTVVFGVAARLQTYDWFVAAPRPWLHPWTWQTQGIALAVLGLAWIVLRIALRRARAPFAQRFSTMGALLNPPWPPVDRVLRVLLVVGSMTLAIYGAAPGALQELSPRSSPAVVAQAGAVVRQVPDIGRFEFPGIPHSPALGPGSWALLALVCTVLFASWWERFEPLSIVGLYLALTAAALLLTGRWESDVAVASAVRWYTAGALIVGSVPIWGRGLLARAARQFNWPAWRKNRAGLGRVALVTALILAVLPLAIMLGQVAIAAVARTTIEPAVTTQFFWFGFLLVVSFLLALGLAQPALAEAAGRWQPTVKTWQRHGAVLLMILGAAPLVALGLYTVGMALARSPLLGPEPTSLFATAGLAMSYALPVIAIALALVGHAVRERSGPLALAASLVLNIGVTAAYLLTISKGGLRFDALQWIRLAHLNAMVTGGFALVWLAAVEWRRRKPVLGSQAGTGMLATQVMLAVALNLLVIVPASLGLALDPRAAGPARVAAADAGGWLALGLAFAAIVWLGRIERQRVPLSAACVGLWAAASLAALSACRWDTGNWLGVHTLMTVYAIAGWLLLVSGWQGVQRPIAIAPPPLVARWCVLFAIFVALLGLRTSMQDPARPWWALAALWCAGGLLATVGGWQARRGLLYAAAMLINLGAMVWWANERPVALGSFTEAVREFVQVNIIALALPTLIWLWIDLRLSAAPPANLRTWRPYPLHRVTAIISLALLTLLTALELWSDLDGWATTLGPTTVPAVWAWAALAATAIAVTANLWDVGARFAIEGLYLLGLTAIGIALAQFDLSPKWLGWMGTMLLASYSLATSYLWSRRGGLLALADRLQIPRDPAAPFVGLGWLVPANCTVVACVVGLVYWVQLTFPEQALRLPASQAAIVQAFAVGLLARGARRSQLQIAALWLGVLGAVAFGWSWLEPGTTGNLLNRAVVLLTAIAAMAALYGIGLTKMLRTENEWTRAGERMVPSLVVVGIGSILFVLGTEIYQYATVGHVAIAWPGIVAVIVALAVVCLACLGAALLPGRDPLGLSERGRTVYVYAAEVLVALLVLHVRLTMPWLFQGFFQRYWPVIVMVVAFAGVGFSELFRRRRQMVLAEPLQNSGAFLPLLPVIGFWFLPTQVHYSLLLLSVGLLYTGLSVTRRSFGFGVLAALAANGGLWYFLHDLEGYGWLEHPQLWLIPPALCVLAAAYLNRDRLEEGQMTAVRYMTSTIIYVASTADIFLNGVAQEPWLPLVLAGLALVGIFAGILLRVRAFLFLGTAFLVLALLTIIWHAAVDLEQTWLWYVSGIVTGILIIVLFAVFEKKRSEVAQLIERLNDWAP